MNKSPAKLCSNSIKGEVMYKKIICTILVLALLSQVGCYSAKVVTLEEVITNPEITELTVSTRDSLRLIFEKPDFTIVNDTLKGKASVITSHTQLSKTFDWNIPLSDIIMFETDEFDGTKTLIFTGATILGVVILFMLFILASGGIMSDFEMKF